MSKMTKPTVDVVKFQESDVIVASGVKPEGPAMYINGFYSSGAQDGSMKYGGNTYFFNDHGNLIDALVADGYDADVLSDPGRQEWTVEYMFSLNHDPATFEQVMTTTGNYYYNRSTSRWEYYQNQ